MRKMRTPVNLKSYGCPVLCGFLQLQVASPNTEPSSWYLALSRGRFQVGMFDGDFLKVDLRLGVGPGVGGGFGRS